LGSQEVQVKFKFKFLLLLPLLLLLLLLERKAGIDPNILGMSTARMNLANSEQVGKNGKEKRFGFRPGQLLLEGYRDRPGLGPSNL
jgi:hypothetical protein